MTFTVEQIEAEARELELSGKWPFASKRMLDYPAMKRREAESVPSGLIDALIHSQFRVDEDGTMVGVSSQALWEAIDILKSPPSQPSTGVPDGWEIDVGQKSIAIRCSDGRKAVLRSDIGMTYNDKVVFDYFTAAAPRSP